MTMRPEDIKNRTFANALRGYDKSEVRSFLFRVSESARELHEQLTATEAQVTAAAETAREEAAADAETVGAEAVDAETVEALTADALVAETHEGTVDEDTTDATHNSGLVSEVHVADSPATPDFKIHDATDLAATERSIADRYGALGDRIADLLRNADESAAAILAAAENDSAAMRSAAETEAAELRTEAEAHAAQLLAEARAIRNEADDHQAEVMAEVDAARNDQDAILAEARATAEAELETFRATAITEVDELRSSAQQEADTLREETVAEAQATLAEREAETTRLLEEAENDRLAARAELEEVRSEVSGLLEQARTQSEFIKQEADEIIRTKVRANFEQAQSRIDVLRNTEVASRERIVRAQSELTSALTRLDSEPAPELDPSSGPAVIEEAERRQGALGRPMDDAGSPADEYVPDDSTDPLVDVVEVYEAENRGGTDAGILVGDDTDLDNQATFEADVAEASQQIDAEADEESSVAAFFGPDTGDGDGVAAEPFGSRFDFGSKQDADQSNTEAVDEEPSIPPFGSTGFGAGGFGPRGATEHVVDDAMAHADTDEGDVAAPVADSESFEPASLSEAIPDEAAGVGGVAEEDALARLVREAMQEAVDSARKHD